VRCPLLGTSIARIGKLQLPNSRSNTLSWFSGALSFANVTLGRLVQCWPFYVVLPGEQRLCFRGYDGRMRLGAVPGGGI